MDGQDARHILWSAAHGAGAACLLALAAAIFASLPVQAGRDGALAVSCVEDPGATWLASFTDTVTAEPERVAMTTAPAEALHRRTYP